MQSALEAHEVLHAVAPHKYAPHEAVTGDGHEPTPLQLAARVATPFVQLAARHEVELDGNAQLATLMPSHDPLQSDPSPAHATRGATGVPTTGEHVPARPVRLHAWHCPVHAVLQQKPSTQKPETHCFASVQAAPFASLAVHAFDRQ